jgi:RNA polymerase sigma-70 factor (family 1)
LTALPKYEEDKLLQSIVDGNEQSFSEVYYHYYTALYAYVLRLVKVPALAEDIVQDIFLKIWEVRYQLSRVKHFRAFLFSMARNHTLNILQSIARSNNALPALVRHFQEQRFDDEALSKDYRKFIERALQAVPSRSRDIFSKCREQGLSYEEVAKEMGISRNAVKKHMVNTIRTLKEAARRDLGISIETCIVLISLLYISLC